MEQGSLEKLKFDKRLRLRQGWIDDQEIEGYIEALPDVSDKIAVESEESEAESEVAEDAPATPVADGIVGEGGEPQAQPAAGFGDAPADPLSPPPFKEI